METAKLFKEEDGYYWTCPHCKEKNHTEKPGKNVQCEWCLTAFEVKFPKE